MAIAVFCLALASRCANAARDKRSRISHLRYLVGLANPGPNGAARTKYLYFVIAACGV